MRECLKCYKFKQENCFDGERNQCRDCRNSYRRERAQSKVKSVKCLVCDNFFKKKNSQKYCSLKCIFLNFIEKTGGCWIWKGSKTNCGYGKIRIKDRFISAHRFSYELFVDNIPKGKIVCHNCPSGDNKLCVNPEHLWLGTISDNAIDAIKKGQWKTTKGSKWSEETREKMKNRPHADRKGEKHHLGKLKEKDIMSIREMLNEGYSQTEIAKKFDVCPSHISNIKNKKAWTHI